MDELTSEQLKRPIWLLADSLPKKYVSALTGALDPRFPTRHSIWTPVWDEIQQAVYIGKKRRVDANSLCVANAIKTEPNCDPDWDFKSPTVAVRIAEYRRELEQYHPVMVLTFGRRAFCFAALARGESIKHRPNAWSCEKLGQEFRSRVARFNVNETNIIPLLHASIARGKWKEAHHGFTGSSAGNYFEFVWRKMGCLLNRNSDDLDIWLTA
jgi:hypothetical protein